ncbi:hypothetical protein [Pedobacter sp. BMA]|uniref:hypothetical protein n=1 Tax=Pedobacter sp. BMA TaxID=1663685 RepID=UPI00064AB5AD|nr:hypothetical protein [Pedobacter sp. BMA]KLT65574.1 hypothetical protein AB669_10910 [Pedobacter sp. BMA]
MSKMDKELIDHIKNKLASHEEAYTPGAWERFAAQDEKKRRGFFYWPLWSAAAILLIFGGILLFQNNKTTLQNGLAKNLKSENRNSDTADDKENGQTDRALVVAKRNGIIKKTNNANKTTGSKPLSGYNEGDLAARVTEQVSLSVTNLSNGDLTAQPQLNATIYSNRIALTPADLNMQISNGRTQTASGKVSFEQLLERDSYNNKLAKNARNKSTDKWQPGVYVAPSMGNDNKVNMNYGFSLSYRVNDKLSLNSGIAYAALSSTSGSATSNSNMMSDAQASASLSSKSSAYSTSSKNLESVNAVLNGINIPLELKYSISKKIYTGIGISALAILNNKQNNNYLVSSTQNTTVANTLGYSEQKMLIVTERVSEQQTESTSVTDKYIGFYNFSLGYKQKIAGKKNFAVEPFLRIPMKTFSSDNLNLTNGGLRLKLDF